MATSGQVRLPEGYVLDRPNRPALPEGFVLDREPRAEEEVHPRLATVSRPPARAPERGLLESMVGQVQPRSVFRETEGALALPEGKILEPPPAISPVERGAAFYRGGVLVPPEGPPRKVAEIGPSETILPMGQAVRELREQLSPLENELIPPEHWIARGLIGTIASAGQVTGNVVEGMATPTNIAVIGGLMAAPQIAGPIVARSLYGLLTVSMAMGAGESLKRAAESYRKGDFVTAGEELVGSGIDALFAYGAGKGAIAKAPEGYLRDAWMRFYTKIGGMNTKEAAKAAEIAVQKQSELPAEVHQEEMHQAAEDVRKRTQTPTPLASVGPVVPPAAGMPQAPTAFPGAPAPKEGEPPPPVAPSAEPFPGAPPQPTEPLIEGIPKLAKIGTGLIARRITKLETELARAALGRGEAPRTVLSELRAEMDRRKFTPEQYEQYLEDTTLETVRPAPKIPEGYVLDQGPPPAAEAAPGTSAAAPRMPPEAPLPAKATPTTPEGMEPPRAPSVRPVEPQVQAPVPKVQGVVPKVEPTAEPTAGVEPRPAERPRAEVGQPWMMTQEELETAEAREKVAERAIDEEILGVEGAKRYARLQHTANSSDRARANAASAEIAEMESHLTKEQQDQLFGVGQQRPTSEDYGEFRKAVGQLDQESPQRLGASLRWALTKIGDADLSMPWEMTREQQLGYAQLRQGFRIAHQEGWDPNIVLQSGLQAAWRRFADPKDAELILRRFMRQEAMNPIPPRLEQIVEKTASPRLNKALAKTKQQTVQILTSERPAQSSLEAALPPETPPVVSSPAREVPLEVTTMPVTQIAVDPQRFQFKQEVGKEGVGIGRLQGKQFRPELAGVVSVWTDPTNGKTYIVNGHHRLEFAKRSGAERLNVMPLQAANAEEARTLGALQNIAEGRGTALDAAKFFRDSGIKAKELAEQGISLGEAAARNGLALSRLDPFLFDLVARGQVSQGRGIAIGEATDVPEQQQAILRLIEKAENRGRRVSDDVVRELGRFVESAGERTEQVQTLFGTEARTESLAIEKAELSAHIKRQIQQEKRLFGAVSGQGRAEQLGKAGNVIRAEENARIAERAAQAEELYEKFSVYKGPVSDILDQASERLAKGEGPNAVKDEAYNAIRQELSQALGRTENAPAPASEAISERQPERPAPSQDALLAGQSPAITQAKERAYSETPQLFSGIDPFRAATAIKELASPVLLPKEVTVGEQQRGIMRERLGELARSKEQNFKNLEALRERYGKRSNQENLDFIDRIEKGAPGTGVVGNRLRSLLDDRREQIQKLGTGKLENFIENYFPHVWEQPGAASELFKRVFASKRPLQGPASFLKKRTIPTTAEGIAAGLKPVSYNPIELTLLKVHEMDRYLMAHRILADMKESGLAKFVRLGDKPPEGWRSLNDNMFQIMHYSEEAKGFVVRGKYYAPLEAALPLNRYLSPGLAGHPAYDLLRGYGNLMNQAQLGMSAFHLTFTSIDAATSDLALAMERVSRGEFRAAIKPAFRALTATSPITNYLKGSKVLKEYLEPGRYKEMSKAADAVAIAGGRVFQDPFYRSAAVKNFWKSWSEKDWAKVGLRVLPAALEYAARPIMEHIVPRQKLGVFANLAEDVFNRLGPDADKVALRKELNLAWDSVDNRMGQLVYDNLFWHRAAKDLSMIAVRSVGWNLGTFREIGGGVKDIGQAGIGVLAGRKTEVTHRMAYIMALPVVVGLYGGIINYLATGQAPQDVTDYYYPRNGGTLPNGKPARDSLASYMKDLVAFYRSPLKTMQHKVHPLWGEIAAMVENEDFYGTEIRHSDDPLVKQIEQVGEYAAKEFTPFSVRNFQQAKENLESSAAATKSFFGLTPAPAYVGQTPAETKAFELAARAYSQGPRTKEQYEAAQERRRLRNLYATRPEEGKEKIEEELRAGTISERQARNIIKDSRISPLVRAVGDLPVEEAYSVWKKANHEERTLLKRTMEIKIKNALRNGPPDNAERVREIGRAVIAQEILKRQEAPKDIAVNQ